MACDCALATLNILPVSCQFMVEQTCDKCRKQVKGLIKVATPENLYVYTQDWCFACVYEKGQADYNAVKNK